MSVCTRENCLQWCLITICPLFTPHCRCHYAFDRFLQPVYRKLSLETLTWALREAHARGDPLASLQSLTWLMHCFVYASEKKASQSEETCSLVLFLV